MHPKRPAWSWLFFVQLALVVLATVLATLGRFPPILFRAPFDKLGHLGAYGLLAFFGVSFFGHARRWPVVVTLLVAATLEELSQRAFPTRTFDLGDLAMNVVGICTLGALAAARLAPRSGPPRPGRALPVVDHEEEAPRSEAVDVPLRRQCLEDERLQGEVAAAERALATARAAPRPPEPVTGPVGWFVLMFCVHIMAAWYAFLGLMALS